MQKLTAEQLRKLYAIEAQAKWFAGYFARQAERVLNETPSGNGPQAA